MKRVRSSSSSSRNGCALRKTKLIRQEHYHSILSENMILISGVLLARSQALDDIYHCFDMCMKGGDEERKEDNKVYCYWENEFLFRHPYLDRGREVVAVPPDTNEGVFSEGIVEFRERTHVVFKEMFFGVMWKVLPLHVNTFKKGYDGCFTKNHDGIMDTMNIVNQYEQFGTILDITKETPAYILWTAF